jgi:hypothetical protein
MMEGATVYVAMCAKCRRISAEVAKVAFSETTLVTWSYSLNHHK